MNEGLFQILLAIVSGGAVVKIFERLFKKHDERSRKDSTVVVAQIGDEAKLREELWKQINDLRVRVDKLQEQVMSFSSENAALKATNQVLNDVNARQSNEIVELRARLNITENHLKDAVIEIEKLKRMCSDHEWQPRDVT